MSNHSDKNSESNTKSINLTALALKKPITTLMLCLTMLLTGFAATQLLPLEKWLGDQALNFCRG